MARKAQESGRSALKGSPDLGQIGARILEIRNQRGWKQRELARRAGLLPSRLSKLERGLREPKLTEVARLAGALGAGLDELVFGEAPSNPTLEVIRELGAVGTKEEMAVLGRLLQLLLLGYRAAESGKEER